MTVEDKRPRRFRWLSNRKFAPVETSPSQSLLPGRKKSNATNAEKQGNGSSATIQRIVGEKSVSSSLWKEVFDSFTAFTEQPDLRAVAKLLREQSTAPSSSAKKNSESRVGASREWNLCREILRIAETKEAELGNITEKPLIRQMRHAYNTIITWSQKFVVIGDVISQVDPLHIGIPWAGIRAILIVAIHDQKTQVEVLARVAYLSKLICRYAVFEEIYLQHQSSLQESLKLELTAALRALYMAVLKYLVETLLYLNHSSRARPFRSMILSGRLEQLYNDVNTNEEELLRICLRELAASHNQYINVRKTLCAYEDQLQTEKRATICDWISKIDYYSHHREMQVKVLSQTGKWFLARKEFTDWIGNDQSSLLWLHGDAGTGKTSLISCVIENLLERPWLDGDEVMAYFYCSRTTNDTRQQDPRAVLLSILRQLAAPLPGLPLKSPIISIYDKETTRGSQEAHLSINEIISQLLELIQNHYQNVTLIFDALDEVDVNGRLQLLDAFTRLTYNPKTVVKTLISSRNDPDIETQFSRIPNVSITATDNADDIRKFVHQEISHRLLRGRASKQIRERVESDLNGKANGVFRWVALQVDALCDPDRVFSVEDIEYLLGQLPKTLEDTYSRLLDDLETLPPPSREAMKNLFKLLICAEFPMTVQDILDALATLSGTQNTAWDKASIIRMARGLITTVSEDNRFIFAHLSVKESLEKRTEYSAEYAHVVAAEACLKAYLRPSSNAAIQHWGFQWYAVTHLGRHCFKSGELRKAPKLGNLMKEFFSTDSNDAFERWNRDCFRTDLDSDSAIFIEKRNCQSRPGLPLFMVCVYGFDEFVEMTTRNQDRAFSAENYFGARPLEVAALYGNYNTMVTIWNAASLRNASSIRAENWLNAAALSPKLNVWNFAIEHINVIATQTALVVAAQNVAHGNEMVDYLLRNLFDIDEDVISDSLKSCISFQILDMILAHPSTPAFTKTMMEAAVQNPYLNPELTEMIMSKHQNLPVSRTCIISAFRLDENSSSSNAAAVKAAVLKALLNSPTRCEISEEMICIVAAFGTDEDIESLDLLLHQCSIDHITEDMLVAAAQNSFTSPAIFEFFVNHSLGHTITSQVLEKLFESQYESCTKFTSLLSQPAIPLLLEESLYEMTEKCVSKTTPLSTIMRECGSMHITDTFLQACARNRGPDDLRHIIFLPRAIPISKNVLSATIRNTTGASSVLKMLLQFKCGFEFEISEDTLLQALSQPVSTLSLIRLLAEQWRILPVTEKSMMAAVRYPYNGSIVFEYLLQYCGSVDQMLTDQVLEAAIEGNNVEFVEYFRKKRPNFEVKEEFLRAAARNLSGTNDAILRILLSQEARCAISGSVLETAARMGSQNTLQLLLEKITVSDSPPNLSDVAKSEASSGELDREITFEDILWAASHEEEQTHKDAYEFSIDKLEILLSRYTGPVLDSTRLVEVAAKRQDGKFIVQYLLSRFPETLITGQALLAAASNEDATTSLLDFLVKHSQARVDSRLLQMAAGNKYRGTQMVQLLLANYSDDVEVERVVIIAALRNQYCGRSLLKLFLARMPDLIVAQDIVDAAYENKVLGKILLQMLLKQALTLCSTTSANLVLRKIKSNADGLRDSLFMAACYGDDIILKFLISHNIPISSVSGELGTALNVAAYAGNVNGVEILLDAGSDPESYSRLYGTPLQTACQQGNLDIARMLVNKGAEIDQPNLMGRTELHAALRQGDYGKVKALIALGASTAKRDYQGMTAMHHASLCVGSADCVKLLIELGVPVDQEDSRQWTPLHWAAKSGPADTIKCLLDAGAAKTKMDSTGKTPFHVAIFCGNVHLGPKLIFPEVSNTDIGRAGEEHPNIICDSCDLSIYGPRYKCTECEDFDLCFACILDAKTIHEPSHTFHSSPTDDFAALHEDNS